MGVEPPFIYDRPSNYTFGAPTDRAFNPKAATEAAWSRQYQTTKPVKDGPLIEFNKHPDSYLIVPYGNLNAKPMNPKTKTRVNRARYFQLFLRVCAVLGALGMLFCVISINKISGAVSWIIRIAPAVALCHTVYAVHHLCRAATGRTAASTASYMVFAGMIDASLLPFLGFAAFMAHADYTRNAYQWSTLFGDDVVTYKIIYAFFLLCVTEGGLFIVSLFMDIYLSIVFRKIARLPPDMNPLESNLTARPNAHKRNKSEMNITEKHMSGSTMASKLDLGIGGRRIPYIHTRTDSADSITLYGTESARNSRLEFRKGLEDNSQEMYQQSQRESRETLSPTRPTSAASPTHNSRPAGSGLDHRPVRSSGLAQHNSRPSSWLSYMDYEGMPAPISDVASEQLDHEVRPMSPVSAISSCDPEVNRMDRRRENWYQDSRPNNQPPPYNGVYSSPNNANKSTFNLTVTESSPQNRRSREPLAMNPPTPQQESFSDENYSTPATSKITNRISTQYDRPALQDSDGNGRPRSGSRSSSFIGSGGKSRFYGNLRNSISSIGSSSAAGGDNWKVDNVDVHQIDDYERTQTMQSTSDYSGNFVVYDGGSDDEGTNHHDYNNTNMVNISHETQWNSPRQVSNSTSYDLSSGYAGLGAEFGRGMGKRREVSGKVAEEGRGAGYNEFGGVDRHDVQAAAINNESVRRGGAAGWARFKGL